MKSSPPSRVYAQVLNGDDGNVILVYAGTRTTTYRASNNVLIGMRLESAVIARGVKGVGGDDVSGDASYNASYVEHTILFPRQLC